MKSARKAQIKQAALDLVNWDAALAAPRAAGGHDEMMLALYTGRGEVIAKWNEGDYQGEIAYAYLLPGGVVAIITDYYGSCGGCDSWEDAGDDDARKLITSIVTSARVFETRSEAAEWAASIKHDDYSGEDYPHRAAWYLREELAESK